MRDFHLAAAEDMARRMNEPALKDSINILSSKVTQIGEFIREMMLLMTAPILNLTKTEPLTPYRLAD
jgi:hypothetical protein